MENKQWWLGAKKKTHQHGKVLLFVIVCGFD
jgi:hypothetical protein